MLRGLHTCKNHVSKALTAPKGHPTSCHVTATLELYSWGILTNPWNLNMEETRVGLPPGQLWYGRKQGGSCSRTPLRGPCEARSTHDSEEIALLLYFVCDRAREGFSLKFALLAAGCISYDKALFHQDQGLYS